MPRALTDNPEIIDKVQAAQVDLLWRNAMPAFVATAVVALILFLVLRDTFPFAIGLWILAVLLITLTRVLLAMRYSRLHWGQPAAGAPDVPLAESTRRWRRRFIAGTALMGSTWGILGAFAFPLADAVGQMMIAVAIAGVVAGAVATNAYVIQAYNAYLLTALIPLTMSFFIDQTEKGLALGFMSLMFCAFMLVSARRVNQAIAGNLIATYRMEALSRELTQAQHDQLTGLPGRALLLDRLHQEILHAERNRDQLAVAFVDLDGFKEFNDRYGHGSGDRLLQEIAARLRKNVRALDTVARYGGDEFVVLLTGVKALADVESTVEKLLASIRAHTDLAGQQLSISASIGIAVFPSDAHNADELIKQADSAMYRAKQRGKNTAEYFASSRELV